MMCNHRHIILVLALLAWLPLRAQQLRDTLELPRWEPHVAVTTGFMGTNYGDNRLFTTVAPSLTFRPSDRWTLTGGFRITNDMGLDPNYVSGQSRDLSPRRRNGGTGVASVYLEADYQVNSDFWLSASLYHMGGQYAPLYGPANGSAFDVSVTALSAAAAFRFSDNNYLHLSFTMLYDHTGMMPYMLYDTWMNHGWGGWGYYANPNQTMAPPMYYGPWY